MIDDNKECISVDLREYIDAKIHNTEEKLKSHINSLKEQCDIRFKSMEIATSKFEDTLQDRLARMNEIRDTMKDQSSHYVTREELAALLKTQNGEIKSLNRLLWTLFCGLFIMVAGSYLLHMFMGI